MELDINLVINFLHEIGIKTQFAEINETSFLPGLLIKDGVLIIDLEKLEYPGDILHEAGHIAVTPSDIRHQLDEELIKKSKDREAEEMMTICWSYAVCRHLNIDPTLVFHDQGYKGGGGYVVENFNEGRYFGLPMLVWVGMTYEKDPIDGKTPFYPKMKTWLRS